MQVGVHALTPANNTFLASLQKERGYHYLEACLLELPCIDWADFVAKMYRRSHKATTALICCRAMHYLSQSYKKAHNQCPNHIIAEILAKQDSAQALKLLDDFVTQCDLNQLGAGSISVHVRAIKRVLKSAGLKIDIDDFRDKVILPKTAQPIEEYPTNEQIRLILQQASPRIRAFVMLLCDTGLGRSEAIRLRLKDFKLDEDPVRIQTQRFKTGEHIETFCTRETAETIKQYAENEKIAPDGYLFVKTVSSRTADKVSEQYIDALKKAGLAQKLEVRIGDEVRQHNYYKFHLHIYRKRWFTKAINVVPAYVAHAMLGRKQYLDQYLAHPLSDRQAFYKRISKHVSAFESTADKKQVISEVAKTLGIENVTEDQLRKVLAIAQGFAKLPVERIDKLKALLSGVSE